jgi:triphosphatase
METELKLLIAPVDVAAFRRLALLKQLATAKPATRLLSNAYFDTPDGNLKHHDMVLRVQRRGQHGPSVFS